MSWRQDTSRLALIDRPIEVLGRVVGMYSRLRFSTGFYDNVAGRVVNIDHGAEYPIKIEFHVAADKRIENFKPAEFSAITILED